MSWFTRKNFVLAVGYWRAIWLAFRSRPQSGFAKFLRVGWFSSAFRQFYRTFITCLPLFWFVKLSQSATLASNQKNQVSGWQNLSAWFGQVCPTLFAADAGRALPVPPGIRHLWRIPPGSFFCLTRPAPLKPAVRLLETCSL